MPSGCSIEERRVLDLYAGSGSLGIEALSRGAATADFVEQDHAASAIIAANLAVTRLDDRARVHRTRVQGFLGRLAERPPTEPFDLVIMDPPYAAPDIVAVLTAVATSPALAPDAIVVVGHATRVPLPDVAGPLTRLHHRCHGDSCFSIYTWPRHGEPADGPAEGAGR
jgi:16S rRNA (guanine966-N2)-methyltransferase